MNYHQIPFLCNQKNWMTQKIIPSQKLAKNNPIGKSTPKTQLLKLDIIQPIIFRNFWRKNRLVIILKIPKKKSVFKISQQNHFRKKVHLNSPGRKLKIHRIFLLNLLGNKIEQFYLASLICNKNSLLIKKWNFDNFLRFLPSFFYEFFEKIWLIFTRNLGQLFLRRSLIRKLWKILIKNLQKIFLKFQNLNLPIFIPCY